MYHGKHKAKTIVQKLLHKMSKERIQWTPLCETIKTKKQRSKNYPQTNNEQINSKWQN
jgi:predicted flavoprotein YhiN